MTSPENPVGHVDDGDLVRYLDNELELDTLNIVRSHIAGCADCQAKLEAIRDQAQRLREALAKLDVPPAVATTPDADSIPSVPSSPTVDWRWRLAAMLAIVVGITLTVTPARAWLLDRLEAVTTLFAPADPAPAPPEPTTSATASSVLFEITDTTLFVEFAVRPEAGILSLQPGSSDTEVSATMRGGSGADELVVFGDGVRVVNTAESTADYSVTLPSRVTLVEVRVGRAVVARHRLDGTAATWEMELAQ